MLACLTMLLLSCACLPDPHRAQTSDLLDQLGEARRMLAQPAPLVDDACEMVGVVQTRLYGEPGLTSVQPAWTQLRDAADALQVACGQGKLLGQPSTDSAATRAARERWSQGIQRETALACDHLRAAAAALTRGAPC